MEVAVDLLQEVADLHQPQLEEEVFWEPLTKQEKFWETLATSCPVFSGFYRKGDTGEGVKSIQTFLNEHMNAGLVVDGMFGPATEKAVHAFQQKYWDQTHQTLDICLFFTNNRTMVQDNKCVGEHTLRMCVVNQYFLKTPEKCILPATIWIQ
jgi:hypothetical protein